MIPPEFDPDGPAEGGGIYGLPFSPEEARVVVLPVPWEATVSYRAGTAGGPAAVLEASRQVDLHDEEVGEPWKAGIAMLEEDRTIRRENARARRLALRKKTDVVDRMCEAVHERVYETSRQLLDEGKFVVLLGGDHSTSFGLVRALAERHRAFGILQIDAHADLREAYEGFTWSHASILSNVLDRLPSVTRLVQLGLRDVGGREVERIRRDRRISACFYHECARARLAGRSFAKVVAPAIAKLPRKVYVTFDVDGLDPSLCPHTGTPVPGGFSFQEACEILRLLAESGRHIVGCDLVEVGADEWDGNVGARLLYKMIGYALF